ncbi:hypothetical protein B0H16DRAFT_239608 [Mycena metata]|uniref:Uncharacterized protein n=1 Tax=Mycena metata TaxID=1033252 RepID=A0AAD7MQP1_9AGAR|nr:hypothetical protein B0H16DRAFT_239608 [Mycena metata]
MAPSLESSTRGTLPIQQSSPVRLMTGMISDYMDYQQLQMRPMDEDLPLATPSPSTPAPFFVRSAVDGLSSTSASFLLTSSPLKSTSAPPTFKPYTLSPIKNDSRYSHLFGFAPQSAREAELMQALRESESRDNSRKRSMAEMQASTVLAGMYTNRAQAQLQAAEERKRRKTGKRKMGDGKAKYFSGDDFYRLCVEDDEKKEQEAAEKLKRAADREAHASRLATWQEANEAIRTKNAERRAEYSTDVASWETEKAAAKAEKRRPNWPKPKLADYGIETLLPKPKKGDHDDPEEEDSDDQSGNGSED